MLLPTPNPQPAPDSERTSDDRDPTPKVTLLIVDDDGMARELIRETFASSEICVEEAGNGIEALEMTRKKIPDMMLVDIQMPHLDGFGLIERIRSDERLRHIPVIATTAYAMVGDEQKALAKGFDRYLAKPIRVQVLRRVVRDLLTEGHRHRQ